VSVQTGGIASAFSELHNEHSVCKFAIALVPPFERGTMWSIVSRSAVPQAKQRPPLRANTRSRCRARLLAWPIFAFPAAPTTAFPHA
jgi:hypothetical protein